MAVVSSATPITKTNLNNALKEYYDGQQLAEIIFNNENRVLLNRFSKRQVAGKYYNVPWMGTGPQGRSTDFAHAQENVKSPVFKTPLVSVKSFYGVVQLETMGMRAVTDKGAFFDRQRLKIDWMLNELSNDIEKALFRSQHGYLGRISAAITTGADNIWSVTLTKAADARNFEIGMEINRGTTTVTGAARATYEAEVSKIDYVNGKIQVTFEGSASSTVRDDWAANVYLFREGDHETAGDKNWIAGLEDWLPSVIAAGDSFFGVNRSSNPQRYGGTFKTGSLDDIEGGIMDLTAAMANVAPGRPSLFLCDYDLSNKLAKELNVERWRSPKDGAAGKAGSYFVRGAMSTLEVVPCTFCQANRGYVITPSSWEIISMGELVAIYDDDGQIAQRVSNKDALEVRGVSYPNLICTNPGDNGRIDFS